MKTRKKVLLYAVIATFLLTLTPSNAFATGEQLLINLGGKLLHSLFSTDSKKKKSGKSVIELIQESVIQSAAKKGKKITFGKLHEQIELNKEARILTYDGTVNNKKTFILLGFTYKGEPKKIAYKGCLWSDDQKEYKETSKEQMRDYFKKYCGADLGPIEPETVETVTYKTPPTPASTSSSMPTTSFAPDITPASY